MHELRVKRIYDGVDKADGFRVLADRLWPRGFTKEKAAIDLWPKSLTPSNDLRKAYHAGDMQYQAFAQEYEKELNGNPEAEQATQEVLKQLQTQNVTLLFATHNTEQNHTHALQSWLLHKLKKKK